MENISDYEFIKNIDDINEIGFDIVEGCNLRCSYCYLNSPNRNYDNISNYLSTDTFNRFFQYFNNSNNKLDIQVSFWGGEPLLKFDVIKYIVNSFNTLRNENRNITYLVVTNGTMISQEVIDFSKTNNLIFQITIDGKKDIHDQQRIDKNRKGSFDKIVHNIHKLKENEINYYIRTVITSKSEYPKELLDYYTELNVLPPKKPQNGIFFGIVTGLTKEETDSFLAIYDFDKFSHSLFEYFENDKFENIGYYVNIMKIFSLFFFTYKAKRSCGILNRRITVKYDGLIFPCHKWVNNSNLSIGS